MARAKKKENVVVVATARQKKLAQNNKELWDMANSGGRAKHIKDAQRGWEFYLNEQLSSEEQSALEKAEMPDFTLNRLTPVIDIMKYFITAKNPRWKAVSIKKKGGNLAKIYEDVSSHVFRISNGRSMMGKVVTDILTRSLGSFKLYIDGNADRGNGELKYEYVPLTSISRDPAMKDIYGRDAQWIMIKLMKSKEQLKQLFPGNEAAIDAAPSVGSGLQNYSQRSTTDTMLQFGEDITYTYDSTNAQTKELVEYYEGYRKVSKKFFNLSIKKELKPETLKQLEKIVEVEAEEMAKELNVSREEAIKEWEDQLAKGEIIESRKNLEVEKINKDVDAEIKKFPKMKLNQLIQQYSIEEDFVVTPEEFQKLVKADNKFLDSVKTKKDFYEPRINVTVSIGEKTFLKEVTYDIRDIPVFSCPYVDTNSPYPIAAITYGIGKQKEMNKTHQITVHHANLSSNVRWMHEEGAVEGDDWDENSTIPGARLVYNAGHEKPVVVHPQPLNNAFYTLIQEGKNELEYQMGIPQATMGQVRDSREPYRSILAQDEFSTRRIKSWILNTYEPFMQHVGEVFKDMSTKFYKAKKVIEISEEVNVDNEKNVFNSKQTIINETIYDTNTGKAIGKFNDYNNANFKVAFVSGSTQPINRWAILDEMFKWYEAGLIPDSVFINQTDIPNKEQVIKENADVNKLKNQLGVADDEIGLLRGQIQTLTRQLISSGIQAKVLQGDKEVTKATEQTKAALKVLEEIARLDTKINQLENKK